MNGPPNPPRRPEELSSAKLALLGRQLGSQRALLLSEPIAIVGMGARFPAGANDLDGYWKALADGVDAVSKVPGDRWAPGQFRDPEGKENAAAQWGAFLSDVFDFDAEFFGITPREALSMDPQHRMLLEVSWEALENAAIAPSSLFGSQTGVFVGISYTDYGRLPGTGPEAAHADTYLGTGTLLSIAAGRISYFLGLHGPCLSVDTACSSSLVSVHLACHSLRAGECDLALAGGVNVLSPAGMIAFSRLGALAADGRCKSFDAAADGYVRGEGCGMVVLKRLSDAVSDGDSIQALIRGSAVNQDGRSAGLTAPNGPAQEAVIRKALNGLDGGRIDYVEAHGTGTPLGDPIEIGALGSVMRRARPTGPDNGGVRPLVIGSVKTNIGHLESAAGIAGLIKVVLSLRHERIPANLNYKVPNPNLRLEEIPAVIPLSPFPWPRREDPRLAGVSSFGFSGTNAHLVIEEAPNLFLKPPNLERPGHVLALSARTSTALRNATARCLKHLEDHPADALPDLCFTANCGRSHFPHRAAFVAVTTADLHDQLKSFLAKGPDETAAGGRAPRIGFFLPGTGPAECPRPFYDSQPVFRKAWDRIAALAPAAADPRIASFQADFAWSEFWRSLGIEPAAVLGLGPAAYTAACIAQALTPEEAVRLARDPLSETIGRPPRVRLISAVTGGEVKDAVGKAEYLQRGRSQIAAAVGALRESCDIVLQIGASAPEYPDHSPAPDNREPWDGILQRLAALYRRGARIRWAGVDEGFARRKLALPTYPFERKRFSIQDRASDSAIAAPDAWFYEVRWNEARLPRADPVRAESGARWLVLADEGGVGQALGRALGRRGADCTLVHLRDSGGCDPERLNRLCEPALGGGRLQGAVYLGGLDSRSLESSRSNESPESLGCVALLGLLKMLAHQEGPEGPRLWVITRGAQAAGGGESVIHPEQAPLWGFGRVAAREHPVLWGGLIDLDPGPAGEDCEALADALLSGSAEDQVAYREGRRYVARLGRARPPEPMPPAPKESLVKRNATYVITGGLGGLGLGVAGWLVANGARHLALIGRRPPTEEQQAAVRRMELAGASIRVLQADVAEEAGLAAAWKDLERDWPPIRGAVHAAGILDDGFIQNLDGRRIARSMAAKVRGAWNLHLLTAEKPLDWFVLFSSAAAVLGVPGQAAYAAGNAYLNALAHHRRRSGLPALAINWGPWADIGMFVKTASRASIGRIARRGMRPLPPAGALLAFERLLRSGTDQAVVLDVDWTEIMPQLAGVQMSGFLSELAPPENPPPRALRADLLARPPAERAEALRTYLTETLAGVIQMPAAQLAGDRNLLELGADSLIAMEFVNNVRRDLGLMLYPREFYEHPTVDGLAEYLNRELDRGTDRPTPATPEAGPRPEGLPDPPARRPRPRAGEKNPPLVFLLSSPRAGSTLLRAMLAGHAGLFCPPELHLLAFATMRDREKALGPSHLGEGLQRAFMELNRADAGSSQAWVDRLIERNAPIEEVYRLLQAGAGSRLIVDKSPSYAGRLETLESAEEIFESPKYIHLVRHPAAVIESFVRMRMDKLIGTAGRDPYDVAEQVWATTNRNLLAFLTRLDPARQHRVAYEDLVRAPEACMRPLCAFLGIPYDPAVLQPYEGDRMLHGIRPGSDSIGDPNFLRHDRIEPGLGEAWRRVELPRPLSPETRMVARQLNYEADPASIEPAGAMRESRLPVRGLRLCVCEWGAASAPAIVLVHGALDHGGAWQAVAERLAPTGYRIIAPDLRGHGKSGHIGPESSYHVLDFLADLEAVVKSAGGGPLILAGHSLGALLAAMFAAARPGSLASLILVEPALPARGNGGTIDLAAHLDGLASPPRHAVFPDRLAAAARLRQATPSLSTERALASANRLTEEVPGGVRWRWDARLVNRSGIGFGLESAGGARFSEFLRRAGVPTLVLRGQSSPFPGLEPSSADEIHSAEIPGGHNLPADAPEELAAHILDFARSGGRPLAARPDR